MSTGASGILLSIAVILAFRYILKALSFIVKQFGFKSGDKIDWTIESIKGNSVIVIRQGNR